jgi:hypothetical protein
MNTHPANRPAGEKSHPDDDRCDERGDADERVREPEQGRLRGLHDRRAGHQWVDVAGQSTVGVLEQ